MIHINNHCIDFLDENEAHRNNGPAYITRERQSWYQNGKRHRDDGPAIIRGDSQSWWKNGYRHRINGPAVIDYGYKEWYIEGIIYTEEAYFDKLKERKEI